MTAVEKTDVIVIGSGFGGSIPAYHLAAGGAKVTILERGPWLSTDELIQDLNIGTWTQIFDLVVGDGLTVMTGNCVGGGSVVYLSASIRAPGFVFERQGSVGRRIWPASVTRSNLDPWYERVEEALPVSQQPWDQVPYPGGLFAAACNNAGRTCNPCPQSVDLSVCQECNWMMNGCRFGAKRSMTMNYLPGAVSYGADIRPLHEVQYIERTSTGNYQVHYKTVDALTYLVYHESGTIEAPIVIVAAGSIGTPVILKRSEPWIGTLPAAVGQNFSMNGDRVSTAVMNDQKVRDVLGLETSPGVGYDAYNVGRACAVASWDKLNPARPEFTRFSIELLYMPPGLGTVLAQVPGASTPTWFGLAKKEMRREWRSWLTVFSMGEDDNEGVFGAPPPVGNFTRLSDQTLAVGNFSYQPTANTLRNWTDADAELKAIVEKDGVGQVAPWTTDVVGATTVHPLSTCRIGDDPTLSALDDQHELRGHPGIFVTDGAAVPTSLGVNPSVTIAALAERAVPGIVNAARARGVDVTYRGTLPNG
jgi:enediyne biosynthesis protein E9